MNYFGLRTRGLFQYGDLHFLFAQLFGRFTDRGNHSHPQRVQVSVGSLSRFAIVAFDTWVIIRRRSHWYDRLNRQIYRLDPLSWFAWWKRLVFHDEVKSISFMVVTTAV